MTIYIISLILGFVAGLRTMMPLAIISWAAYLQWLGTLDGWLSYFGSIWTVSILTILALVELVTDQLPSTPSRKVPIQFGARIISGAVSGAVIGTSMGNIIGGLIAGMIGALTGTLVGHAFRSKLATKLGNDHYAAVIEDIIAIVLALFAVQLVA